MNVYRVDRGHAAVLSGILLILAGVVAFVAFLVSVLWLAYVVVALLVLALLVVVRPVKVATLDEHGLRGRGVRVRWVDVENVTLESGQLVLSGDDGEHRLALATVGRRGPELVREVQERMNTAHGYTRWDPTA